MVVPEQGQLLAQGMGTEQHALQPPAAQVEGVVVLGEALAGTGQVLFAGGPVRVALQEAVEGGLESLGYRLAQLGIGCAKGCTTVKMAGPLEVPGILVAGPPRLPDLGRVKLTQRRKRGGHGASFAQDTRNRR